MTDTAQGGGLRLCMSATHRRSRAGRKVAAGKTGPFPHGCIGWAGYIFLPMNSSPRCRKNGSSPFWEKGMLEEQGRPGAGPSPRGAALSRVLGVSNCHVLCSSSLCQASGHVQ